MRISRTLANRISAGVLALTAGFAAPALADKGGLKLLIDSLIALDAAAGTATLPLHAGSHDGDTVFYVVTESSDRDDARARGVNYSPKLANALGSRAVQRAVPTPTGLAFAGSVDFTPERVVVAGPDGFPPAEASPGSVGDADYSPLVTVGDGIVLNAPHIANASGLHDKVLAMDTVNMQVTLELTDGLYHGKEILYLSTDASDPVGAALEGSTLAVNLDAAPGLASNDPLSSARSSIVPIVNGATGVGNPDRQGLASAVLGEGPPLNITVIHPRNRSRIPEYSPLWDVHPAVWTEAAIASGQRQLLDHHRDVAEAVEDGLLVSAGAGPANPDLGGLRAAGFIVNCPVFALR